MKTFEELNIGDDFTEPNQPALIYTKINFNKFETYYERNKKVERIVFTADPHELVQEVIVE